MVNNVQSHNEDGAKDTSKKRIKKSSKKKLSKFSIIILLILLIFVFTPFYIPLPLLIIITLLSTFGLIFLWNVKFSNKERLGKALIITQIILFISPVIIWLIATVLMATALGAGCIFC